MPPLNFSEPFHLKTINLKSLSLFLLFLGFAGFRFEAIGQACFNFIGDSIGCAPFTVSVRSCAEASAAISFNFKYKPDWVPTDYQTLPVGQTDISFTYSSPGEYIIDQLRGGGQTLKRKVRVYSFTAKPEFSWATCKDTILISFTDTVFSAYQFSPGDGSGDILVQNKIKIFKYKYNFIGNVASFTFTIKGDLPPTCNKDPITNTVSLYKNNEAPKADTLIGIDTLTYRLSIQTRADEPFGYQFRKELSWNTVETNITPDDNPKRKDTLFIPSASQKSGIRAVTLNGCGNQIAAPDWTLFWVKTRSDNQKIYLEWPKVLLADLVEFKLLRNSVSIKDLISFADTNYIDSLNLVCGETYCYQIMTKRLVAGYSGLLLYLSAPICGQAISNRPPDPIKFLTATVEKNGIKLSGKSSPLAKTFEIFRKEREEDLFEKIATVDSLSFTDTSARTNTTAYCYKIVYKDICGNQSLSSDTLCPVLLRLETPGETDKQFIWTAFSGWRGGINRYELLRKTKVDSDIPSALDVGNALSYQTKQRDPIRQKVIYQIKVVPEDSISYPSRSYSNPVEYIQNSKLRFPDVFTANEDGFNDGFGCYSLFIRDYELRIFNSWGNVIFTTRNINEKWFGLIDTKPAQAGPYAYWATGVDEEGNTMETKGYFNLIR